MRCCVCWIAFSLAVAPAATHAETFFVEDGTVVEGTVLRSLGNTLTIKRDNGGMYQLPLSLVDRVEIVADDGELIAGSLAWWAAKVYVVVTSDGLVEVKDGVIKRVSDPDQAPSSTVGESSPALGEPTPARDADRIGEAPAPATRSFINEQEPKKLEPTM